MSYELHSESQKRNWTASGSTEIMNWILRYQSLIMLSSRTAQVLDTAFGFAFPDQWPKRYIVQ
jgi:hypothetical protein